MVLDEDRVVRQMFEWLGRQHHAPIFHYGD
jgi:hypothetical protein